jgi:serine/threonine-protein kinase
MIGRILKIAGLLIIFMIITGLSAYFTLSIMIKSEGTVIVPNFIGKDIVHVLEFLGELGLNTRVKGSEFSNEVPKNHVIFQDPEPGTEVKKGRDVKFIISKGISTIATPNLKGISVQQARIILEEFDLCPGKISGIYHSSIEKEEVISQFPESGLRVKKGICVSLLVSRGVRPRAYIMPDLTGLSIEEAIFEIEESNLVYGETESVHDRDQPRNIIIAQEPPAGHRVMEESRVILSVNRNVLEADENDTLGTSGRIFRHRISNGFLKKHVRVQMNRNGLSFDLFNDFVKPGEEILILVPGDSESTVILWEDDTPIQTLVYNE